MRPNRPLKNVFEAADTRQKQAKKRSLCGINEHFELVFNTVAATQIVFQRPAKLFRIGWLIFLAMSSSVAVASSRHSTHEPHVHGIAVLNIIVEKNEVHLALESPAMNLLGFEHAPVTDEQKAAYQATQQKLTEASKLFAFPGASCQLESSDIQLLEKHPHTDHDDHEHSGEHADVHADYRFNCSGAQQLNEITIHLFTIFQGIQQIKVQWITGRSQGMKILTPATNHLQLK